jgi:hypothetical protein
MNLSEAIKSGRLEEFIAQEEARGVGPATRKELDAAIKRVATQPQSGGRASRSSSRGGSTGK